MSYQRHVQTAQAIAARCAVVTLSDTRTEQSDTSGRRIKELLEADGHSIASYRLIPDDPAGLARLLDEFARDGDVDVVLTNGGTGISRRDNTIAVVESKLTL